MLSRRIFQKFSTGSSMILKESRGKVAILTLNRLPVNPLCDELITQLNQNLQEIDADNIHSAIVLTGAGEKAFAAGADIKEMSEQEYPHTFTSSLLGHWENLSKTRKPIIAAVNGVALGGGFELALMCDIIYASTNAKFGLPEITLGTIPGGGGTQRLIREIGKSRAMEMILTGEHIKAEEAKQLGIISKVFEQKDLVEEAIKTGEKIGAFSRPTIAMAKDCINAAYQNHLSQGLEYEKRVFWATFATQDQKEGMGAFKAKRKAEFKHK